MYTYRFKRRQIDVDSATTGLRRYSFVRLINGPARIARDRCRGLGKWGGCDVRQPGWSFSVAIRGRWRGAKKNQNNRDFGLRLMIDLAVDCVRGQYKSRGCGGGKLSRESLVRVSRSIFPWPFDSTMYRKNTTFGIQHVRMVYFCGMAEHICTEKS